MKRDTNERYLSYILFRKSGNQHNQLEVDLQNDFTTGYEHYPKNIQGTRMLLERYTKYRVIQHNTL